MTLPLEKARLARLEALQAQCDAILQRCYQRQREAIEAAAQGLAVEQYDHALYDIEQYTGFQSSYAQLPTRAIRQMLAMPVQGSDLSTALWRQDMDTGFQIRRMLGLMFTTGRPPQDFARELQRIIGRRDAEGNLTGKTYEAYRLLYNEAAHVSEQAKLAAYGEDGIEELEIVTTLDSKTCGDCGPRDGKRIKVKDAVEGVNIPPFHVNCRCSTAPYVAAAQGSFARTRAARDPVTGKTVRVKAQTFEEWKKERDSSFSAAIERKAQKLYNKGVEISEQQFGKKIGKHAQDFGLSAADPGDRKKLMELIQSVARDRDFVVQGLGRGQGQALPNGSRNDGIVDFLIKGNDVVVAKDGVFITILKNGVTENSRVRKAIKEGRLNVE